MNLNRLTAFHAAAETLNFSKAAARLNITQPAISAQIRILEEDLSVKLFTRIGKKIVLTEAGELLRSYTRRIFRLHDEAEAVINELRLVRRGTLKVGTTHTYAGHIMPPLLQRFQLDFPLVKVILYEGSSLEMVKRVVSLEIEVAVVAHPGSVKNAHFELLKKEDLLCVASPDNPLAKNDLVPIKQLASEKFIMREQGSSTRMIARDLFKRHRINPAVVFETSNSDFIREQAIGGMGLCFLTRSAVQPDVDEGRLCILKLEGEDLKLEIFSVVRAGHDLSKPALAFLDIISDK